MAGGFFRLAGAASLLRAMEDAIRKAQGIEKEYWVGSAVDYGVFHELGTSKLIARPHWTPSIERVSQKFRLDVDGAGTNAVNQMLVSPRGLVLVIALSLEREVKISITVQGILETSNYRGSIATGPSEAAVIQLSQARMLQ